MTEFRRRAAQMRPPVTPPDAPVILPRNRYHELAEKAARADAAESELAALKAALRDHGPLYIKSSTGAFLELKDI